MSYNSFGEIVRDYRLKNKFTLRELGKALGISVAYLHDLETGARPVAESVIERFEQFTGTELPNSVPVNLAMKPGNLYRTLEAFPDIKEAVRKGLTKQDLRRCL